MGQAPWTVSGEYSASNDIFTFEKALEVEANPPIVSPPTDDFTSPASGGGDAADITWPLGSPTNYALALAVPLTLDDGGQTESVGIYHSGGAGNVGSLNDAFGHQAWQQYRNDHDEYIYTMRDQTGRPHLVSEQDVLSAIGRSYGQRGR